MTGMSTADAWAFARLHLCHHCNGSAEVTCEACGRRICHECSTPDDEHLIYFCRECVEGAS